MATQTPNLGLHVVPESQTDMLVRDWRIALAGDGNNSNMMLLDTAVAALRAGKANRVVEAAAEPPDLEPGDEWDRLL